MHRPVHRRRPGRPGRHRDRRRVRGALTFPAVLGASSPGSFPPTGPTPPASFAISARSPPTPAARCWSKTPPSRVLLGATHWRRLVIHPQHRAASGASTGNPTSQGIVGAGNPAYPSPHYLSQRYITLVAHNFADTTRTSTTQYPRQTCAQPLHTHPGHPLRAPKIPPIGQGTYVILPTRAPPMDHHPPASQPPPASPQAHQNHARNLGSLPGPRPPDDNEIICPTSTAICST
jgi:hypothetical protein